MSVGHCAGKIQADASRTREGQEEDNSKRKARGRQEEDNSRTRKGHEEDNKDKTTTRGGQQQDKRRTREGQEDDTGLVQRARGQQQEKRRARGGQQDKDRLGQRGQTTTAGQRENKTQTQSRVTEPSHRVRPRQDKDKRRQEPLVAFLFLASLLLVVRPGAPSSVLVPGSVLAPSRKARSP